MTTKQNAKTVPYISKMLLETDRVKIYEVKLKPGEKNEIHCHPDYFIFNLTDNKLLTTDTSGKTHEREYKAEQSAFLKEQAHMAENIGDKEARLLIVEMKS